MSDIIIREATEADAEAMLDIYRPIVRKTAISFEITTPGVPEFISRIRATTRSHAWLVAELAGKIIGYAYATPHRAREAYAYSVETSAYIHESQRRRGVGLFLYERLFERLVARGFFHAYAGITLPNPGSIALHSAAGFREIGVFPSVGYKLGQWHDVAWWHRMIQHGAPKKS